jgi:hypothetical protein
MRELEAFGEWNATSAEGLLDGSRQRLNSSGQSIFCEGISPAARHAWHDVPGLARLSFRKRPQAAPREFLPIERAERCVEEFLKVRFAIFRLILPIRNSQRTQALQRR